MNTKRFNAGACHGTIYEKFRQSEATSDSDSPKGSMYATIKLTRLRENPDKKRNYHTERFSYEDLGDLKEVVDGMLGISKEQIEDINNWNRERYGSASPSKSDKSSVSITEEFGKTVYVSGPIKAVQTQDPITEEEQIQIRCTRKTFSSALLPNVSCVLDALMEDTAQKNANELTAE